MIEALNLYAMVSAAAGITVGIWLLRGANGQSKILLTFMVVLACAFAARSDAQFLGTDWVRPLANIGITNSIFAMLAYYAVERRRHK